MYEMEGKEWKKKREREVSVYELTPKNTNDHRW